jgi:transcriptional regulator with XRE-family HTH domain
MPSTRDEALQVALGARLRAVRQQRGLTLEQVAARINAPISVVGRIEGGGRGVSIHTLFALARALGCQPADLVNLDANAPVEGAAAPVSEEGELVALWRVAPEEVRDALLRLLRAAVRA